MDTYIPITADNGEEEVTLNARLVSEGEHYGMKRVFVCDGRGSLIEFFTAEQEGVPGYDPLGKHVVRYFVSVLMQSRPMISTSGLDIHGQEASYHIPASSLATLFSWLDTQSWKPYSVME